MVELTHADDRRLCLGYAGDSYDTAVYLARTSDPATVRVAYCTAAGDDWYSQQMLADMRAEGIDTSRVRRLVGRTPGLSWSPPGRTANVPSPTTGRPRPPATCSADDSDRLAGELATFDLVYLSGITLQILAPPARQRLWQVPGQVRSRGTRDTSPRPLPETPRPGVDCGPGRCPLTTSSPCRRTNRRPPVPRVRPRLRRTPSRGGRLPASAPSTRPPPARRTGRRCQLRNARPTHHCAAGWSRPSNACVNCAVTTNSYAANSPTLWETNASAGRPSDRLITVAVSTFWSFVVVVGLLTMTPGMDTALILRTAAVGESRRAWGVVMGIQSGTLTWGVLTSAGVTALLTASHLAYEVLRWVGACYLIWIGLSMLWAARCHGSGRPAQPIGEAAASGNAFYSGWRRGALTNLLNPKMGAFYVALLPQFIPTGADPFAFGVLLACVHVLFGTAWSAVLVGLARRLRAVLQHPVARRVLDRVTGTVITGFGLRLATSSS
jgi:threonine/homoserine/homoserine lactone efflux protein